jgi:hypothetical protein
MRRDAPPHSVLRDLAILIGEGMKLMSARDLALFFCWIVCMGFILTLLARLTSGDIAAISGAMAMWLYGVLGVSWYEMVVSKRPYRDETPDKLTQIAWDRWRQLLWPMKLMSQFLPGLWIGFESRDPFLVALGYLLIVEVIGWLNERLPPALPEDPLPRRYHSEGLLRKAGLVFIGAAAGVALRHVLGI